MGNGPQLRNTPDLDGAYVELSPNGRFYWPTVVFEMAHETVHLLNPVPGNTNNLEEGVAVAFSLHVQPSYEISVPVCMRSYEYALMLANSLPGGALTAAKAIRHQVGALSAATTECLAELFLRSVTTSLRTWSTSSHETLVYKVPMAIGESALCFKHRNNNE